jgi:hypothetical protein
VPTLQIPDRPQHFGVVVPESWAIFDLAHLQLAEARREAMAQASSKEQRLTIDQMFAEAKRVTRSARRAGAIWGAATATVFDDGLFVAHAMVFAVTGRPGADFTTPLLSEALAGERSPTGLGDLPAREVGPVELRDGIRGTRVTGVEDVQVVKGKPVRVLASHTFVPVPGTTDEYLLLTGISPNLDYGEAVLDLFDAIASTFTFYTDLAAGASA